MGCALSPLFHAPCLVLTRAGSTPMRAYRPQRVGERFASSTSCSPVWSNLFRAGHRIRVDISSTCFPPPSSSPSRSIPLRSSPGEAPSHRRGALYPPSHIVLHVTPERFPGSLNRPPSPSCLLGLQREGGHGDAPRPAACPCSHRGAAHRLRPYLGASPSGHRC